ncbi:MAG: hypothetical protein E7449_00440 [Ruminococcaceae bacterium]|nr:hypothetical protein [Oscillospiraceae bacterium]
MGSDLLLSLLVSLLLTLLIELCFARLRGVRGRDLLVVTLCNCLTNPPVVLLHSFARMNGELPMVPVVIVLEVAAVLIEWRCYKAASSVKKPFWFSLQANALSYFLGLVLQMIEMEGLL